MEFRLTHIKWGPTRFHTLFSASEAEYTSGYLDTNIDDLKSYTNPFKWKDSKDIMDAVQEDPHYVEYEKFGQFFMASAFCAEGRDNWTG